MDKKRKKRDPAISFSRFVATWMIVFCHIMQYFGVELAWWLNVGVQMFLFISGYLYSRRNIKDPILFYKKTISKILLDYYVYIFIFIIIRSIIDGQFMDLDSIFGLITFSTTAYGVRHLWFIPYIVFCYVLTPYLVGIFDKLEKYRNTKFIIYTIFLLCGLHMAVMLFVGYFNPAWVVCFVFGMAIARIKQRKNIWILIESFLILMTIILNAIQIYFSYFKLVTLPVNFTSYAHVLLGSSLTLLLWDGFNLVKKCFSRSVNIVCSIKHLLKISDKYSYDIYIVHHFYILSDVSIYYLLGGFIKPTILVIALTLFSAMVLRYIAVFVRYCLVRIRVKRL